MPFEVISEPYIGREDSRGGFGQRRLFVTIRKDDGTTERVLAADAMPRTPKGARGKSVEGEAVVRPARSESSEVSE